MKVLNRKYNTNDFKKIYKSIFDGYGERTISNLKIQYERFNYIYMKFVKGDKIESSLNKVNTSQHELTKFREKHVDFMSQLSNIRFELNRLNSQIYEAKRLENDVRYLELVRKERVLKSQEKFIQNDYYNSEKKEHSLKDNLAIAREELHINQRVQGDYVKHLGVIVAIGSFIFFIVRVNYDSSKLEKYVGEISENMTSLQRNLTKFEEKPSNSESGLLHYLGKYTGVNKIISWARSDTNNNAGSDQNRGYMFYVAKYSGISYVAWLVKGSKKND